MSFHFRWGMCPMALLLACSTSAGHGRSAEGCVAAYNPAVHGWQVRGSGCNTGVKSLASNCVRLRSTLLMRGPRSSAKKQAGMLDRRMALSALLATAMASGSVPALAADVQVGGDSFPALDARGATQPPQERKGLKAKWLEKIRMVMQDEADNVVYDGELAPGGPPPANPGLMLLPIVQMQAALLKLKSQLADQKILANDARWDELLRVVSSGNFEPRESKRIFNAYSDNIYYKAGSKEANLYLLGGATPSTGQTMQYLLRNEALDEIEELCDELKYQKGLAAEKRETKVAQGFLKKALKAFDEYLTYAPPDELKFANDGVYGSTLK